MKKQFLSILFIALPLMLMAANVMGDILPIPFSASYVDPTLPQVPFPKSPVEPPIVYLDGHTLDFQTNCDGCTLTLIDETDNVAYNTVIPAGTTYLPLPSSLTGTYTIQIICGNWKFTGEIELE